MKPIQPDFIDQLSFNEAGLIPAVAQDWLDGAVLMLAWMNRSAIEETINTGQVHYWSRSRQELWHKGATSGHTQILRKLNYDCDCDVLLLTIEQTGGISCHTGARSCFFQSITGEESTTIEEITPPVDACSELFRVINNRRNNPIVDSYTNNLLNGGDNRILKKIGEESAEFVMACKDNDPLQIASEAADLIFHLQVALAHHQVSWREVQEILAKRRGAPRRGQGIPSES